MADLLPTLGNSDDPDLIHYLRRQQMRRLTFRSSLWQMR